MKPSFLRSLAVGLTFGLVCSFPVELVCADKVRKPTKAGSWYPADSAKLKKEIDHFTRLAQKAQIQILSTKHLKALILPHAGIACSGQTAAHASFVLIGKRSPKVILMGPDHYVRFRDGAISDVNAYETPLGSVKLHPDAHKLRSQSDLFQAVPASDRNEHSLEMVLLFLQSYMENFRLIPIVVCQTNIQRIAQALDKIIDSDSLLVVSSDLSHYLPYAEAIEKDRETIQWILNLEASKLLKTRDRACGAIPISILIQVAQQHNWQPVLLHYSNSGDTCGNRAGVVGYAAIAFFGDQPMQKKNESSQQLSEKQGQVLVKLARQTIMEKLGCEVPETEAESVESALADECYQSHCGTFVTLKIDGQLRGCIGNLTATEPLSEGVRQNAINAAFHDPRFSPLTEKELDQIDIEVSILTEPQSLGYSDSTDLLSKLRVNVDGLIVRKGYSSATFLPQVWEQLPNPEDFLAHLCMKAGLPSDAWRDTKLEVLTYQVQYFEEHK
jgi:AmmeMemoRadiSam system protein B/AmmeMemoRadiSam system protein A